MMRILRPNSGDGVGGIPTIVMAQKSDAAATATVHEWTITGTATANATHSVVVNGRYSIDFKNYSYSVVKGDTPAAIAQKIADAVNGVLGSPVSATVSTDTVVLTTKWTGQTSAELVTKIDFGTTAAGVSYTLSSETVGAGTINIADALAQFGNSWYTTVINQYGEVLLDTLEAFNGKPSDGTPTGLYNPLNFKPFIALFGSTLDDKDEISAITDAAARVAEVTNALCPAPKSEGFPWEAAANMGYLYAVVAQNTPHLDVNNLSYPDMPVPTNGLIGDMADYNNRDFLLQKGASTVQLENGAYKVQDFVTTYHPEGETPLIFNYCRNLNIDFNVRDTHATLERLYVLDNVLLKDDQVSSVKEFIKPIQWKGILNGMFTRLAEIGLITEPEFSQESLQVQISTTNPNRIESFYKYKRSGLVRIASTDVAAGF